MLRSSGLISFALAISLTTACAFAARPGFYVGGQAGWGDVHDAGISIGDMGYMVGQALGDYNFTIHTFNGTTSGTGFAWRAFGGYQIGYNWAMEIGWAQFNNLPVEATATGTDLGSGLPFSVGTDSGIFKTTVFDLVGKYMYYIPCFCPLSIFGKLGLAYVTGHTVPVMSVTEAGVETLGEDVITATKVFPEVSIGLGYDFRNDITADFTYTHIQKVGNTDHLGNIDELMLGMALHFG